MRSWLREMSVALATFGLALVCFSGWTNCQNVRNASGLLLEADFKGPVARSQSPDSITYSDTAISVRYVLMYAMINWNAFAACDPVALNLWGERDPLPIEVCSREETPAEMFAYSYLRAAEQEFPEPAKRYAALMRENGYDPQDRSVDKSTAVGMANAIGIRIAEWLGEDGMNSRGDWSRAGFGLPYEDYSGYSPVNSPWKLRYPLRWQPLRETDSRVGRYNFQAHVFPYLGWTRPLLLTKEELMSKYSRPPFPDMNVTELSGADAERLDGMVSELMDVYANLTPDKRFAARWWDSKFSSVGFFEPFYHQALQFDHGFRARWMLGDMFSQHDALVLAWKEKRRIDAVRPKTIIQQLYGDKAFKTYSGANSLGHVLGKAWEPLVTTQPHSEFPSASSCLCTAFEDFVTLMLEEHMANSGLAEQPPFIFDVEAAIVPMETEGVTGIAFKTINDAAENCRQSRLWAGVHFSPSVDAGKALAEGLGMKAYVMAKDLSEGRIPANCWWCTNTE